MKNLSFSNLLISSTSEFRIEDNIYRTW